ncbi:unnamed protein product [Angiostrongylus costaricensis]|uniref:Uncharacterized protein n=1 Tax=Angiostrongylus costaricensis TaxID=334426 RepID=A0A0R3PHA3_ANGCS|nr:unnamed protein product [Angiostrongylus costaricensis]
MGATVSLAKAAPRDSDITTTKDGGKRLSSDARSRVARPPHEAQTMAGNLRLSQMDHLLGEISGLFMWSWDFCFRCVLMTMVSVCVLFVKDFGEIKLLDVFSMRRFYFP